MSICRTWCVMTVRCRSSLPRSLPRCENALLWRWAIQLQPSSADSVAMAAMLSACEFRGENFWNETVIIVYHCVVRDQFVTNLSCFWCIQRNAAMHSTPHSMHTPASFTRLQMFFLSLFEYRVYSLSLAVVSHALGRVRTGPWPWSSYRCTDWLALCPGSLATWPNYTQLVCL